jgi:Carbohydrate-binding family 9
MTSAGKSLYESSHQFLMRCVRNWCELFAEFDSIVVIRNIRGTKSKPHFLLLAICTLTCASGHAAESTPDPKTLPAPKRVVIPKLHGSIKIDGELTESVWSKAAVLQPFYENENSHKEREHTELRLWYDNTALYLAWICRDIDIQATFTNRDSKFWEEEVVEMFITPKALNKYFELQWNPIGGVFDAIITNTLDANGVSKAFEGDWSFTAKGMRSAAKLKGTPNDSNDKDEFWQVEVMVPFADLGQTTPKAGDVWRGNFYRFNRTKGLPAEQLSWSPTLLPGFHQPSRFGYLEFGK